jgi:hypothetical protein
MENTDYQNVHLATAHALFENPPDTVVHDALFLKVKARTERIFAFVCRRTPYTQAIIFHALSGPTYIEAVHSVLNMSTIIHEAIYDGLDLFLTSFTGAP